MASRVTTSTLASRFSLGLGARCWWYEPFASLRNQVAAAFRWIDILGIVIRLGWNAYWPYGGSRVVPGGLCCS